MPRTVAHRYIDPLTWIWQQAAQRIGLQVTRTPAAYAMTDGRGELALGDDPLLDPDDSLGQMIFHELCHSLVEGEESFRRPDWGLDNTGPEHDVREHACLRVQWVLAGRHGLREVFAPTTDFRQFWDALGGDVLADRNDLSVQLAIAALQRSAKHPWAPHLETALDASARIGRVASETAPARPLPTDLIPLWTLVRPAPAPHPTTLPAGESDHTCGDCAWRYQKNGASRCRQRDAAAPRPSGRIDDAWPACERWEAALDCLTCGACCREAYHSVEIKRRDPMLRKRPEYVVDRTTYLEVRREGPRCAALHGGEQVATAHGSQMAPLHCMIYDDRPQTCRDFTLGSAHCLTARRRVGLSL